MIHSKSAAEEFRAAAKEAGLSFSAAAAAAAAGSAATAAADAAATATCNALQSKARLREILG